MDTKTTTRALVHAAYEAGWRDACDDHIQQRKNAEHAIGDGKRPDVDRLLVSLDPFDLLGLRA